MTPSQKISDLLLATGLSESEVLIYQELLKKPVRFVYELVARTGLSKSSVYRAVDQLRELKMIQEHDDGISPASLRSLVSHVEHQQRKLGKTVQNIRSTLPFLHLPDESVTSLSTFYSHDYIADAFLLMAEQSYDVNLDFGDFEGFLPLIGGLPIGQKFQDARKKHAKSRAICTTTGPLTEYYCNDEQKEVLRNHVSIMPILFKNRFVIFSDTGRHVLYVTFEDPDDLSATLVESRIVADIERERWRHFSQFLGN